MAYPGKTKWIAWPAPSVALRDGLALVSVAVALGLARIFLYFHWAQAFTAFERSAIATTFGYGATKPSILAALGSHRLLAVVSLNMESILLLAIFMTLCFWSLRSCDLGYASAK
jgi:hypothetical protein